MFYSSLKMITSTAVGRQQQKKLGQIINNLIDLPQSTQFLHPVPWREMELDDYPEVIKHPMNLLKVQQRYRNRDYSTVQQALDQIQLIWDNCKEYNQQGMYFELADKMQKAFKKMIKNYLPNIQVSGQLKLTATYVPPPTTTKRPAPSNLPNLRQSSQSKPNLRQNNYQQTPQQSKSQIQEQQPEPQVQQIPMAQKNRFHQRLKLITQQQLAQIVVIIQQNCSEGFKHISGGRYQIVMDNIDLETFKKVNQKVDQFIENEKINMAGNKKIKV